MSGLRQRQTMSSNAGKVQRVADYIKSEVVMPDGQPSGSVLRRADKQLGGVILSISQAIWFLAIAIGILFYQGDPTGAEKHAFHNLVWFDHLLRMFGPLFPFMVLATRFKLASLAPDILAFDRQPWLEQLIVYIGITATRTGIYYIHRLGIFYYLARAGAVSALPAHLMSDHVFLGSSLVALLAAEAVLLARDIRHAANRLHPAQQSILVITFLSCSFLFSLLCGDMYFTCRFYHAPIQNVWAVILGLVFFQLPVSYWLLRGKSGQVASAWTNSRTRDASVEMS